MFVLRVRGIPELANRYRSYRADCICAIPSRPGKEHAPDCPVRRRDASAAMMVTLVGWLATTFGNVQPDGLPELTLPCPFACGRSIQTSARDAESLCVNHEDPHCSRWTKEVGLMEVV